MPVFFRRLHGSKCITTIQKLIYELLYLIVCYKIPFAWQCVQKCLGINRFSNFKLAQSYLGITRNLSDLRTILCRLLNYKFLKKMFSQPRRYEFILCMHLIKSNVEGFDVFTALLCYGGGERDRRVGLYFIVRRYF